MSKQSKIAGPLAKVVGTVTKGTVSWKDKLFPEDYEQLKATFDLFDEDHSGYIDPEEINKIML
jgi:Ca2+-binding EF-hand superfamily protein